MGSKQAKKQMVISMALITSFALFGQYAHAVTPTGVSGKEYSDDPDISEPPAIDPEQVLNWDGAGNVSNGFDYSGSIPGNVVDTDVDAIASPGDAFFFDVIADNSDLIFSVVDSAYLYGEKTDGTSGIWATPNMINNNAISEIDAVELYGPEAPGADAFGFSLNGDWGTDVSDPNLNRVSVWRFDGTNTSTPLHTQASLANAIGLDPNLAWKLDVDAMMLGGDWIMFSVDALFNGATQVFDGGEIWVWDGINPATPLVHGGHTWDTAFDVKGTFGLLSENINALESVGELTFVPVPAAVWLFGSGLLGLVGIARRKKA